MKEILVDLREYELKNTLGKDLISVDELLNILEEKIWEVQDLKEQLEPKDEEFIDDYEERKMRCNE